MLIKFVKFKKTLIILFFMSRLNKIQLKISFLLNKNSDFRPQGI